MRNPKWATGDRLAFAHCLDGARGDIGWFQILGFRSSDIQAQGFDKAGFCHSPKLELNNHGIQNQT